MPKHDDKKNENLAWGGERTRVSRSSFRLSGMEPQESQDQEDRVKCGVSGRHWVVTQILLVLSLAGSYVVSTPLELPGLARTYNG